MASSPPAALLSFPVRKPEGAGNLESTVGSPPEASMDYRRQAAELYQSAAHPSPTTLDSLVEALAAPDALVRHVAGIELAKLDPNRLPEKSIRELLDTLARLEYLERLPLEQEYAEATVNEGDSKWLGQEIVLAFAALHCSQADYVIPRLLEFWSFDSQLYELAHAMLALAFPVTSTRVEKEALSGVQYRILQALVVESAIWCSDGYWAGVLSKHGLPQSRDEVFCLLGYQVW
jgi:hypothetical protein